MIGDDAALLLVCLAFGAIVVLPRLFFKSGGRLNVRWWLTAAPFVAAPATLLALRFGLIAPPGGALAAWPAARALVAAPLAAASLACIAATVATHRVPIALWHQGDDAPVHLVTWGPYGLVRHPFYASFLLTLGAAAILAPHAVTLATLAYGLVALNLTAAREERRLAASEFGAEYQAYLARTGRFVPRLFRRAP